MQAGRADTEPDRSHCPVVTAEGLPEDQPAEAKPEGEDAQAAAKEEAPYEEGCFVAFAVVGDLPEGMPVGAKLRELLGATGGLKFVDFDTARSLHRRFGAHAVMRTRNHTTVLTDCAR